MHFECKTYRLSCCLLGKTISFKTKDVASNLHLSVSKELVALQNIELLISLIILPYW